MYVCILYYSYNKQVTDLTVSTDWVRVILYKGECEVWILHNINSEVNEQEYSLTLTVQ